MGAAPEGGPVDLLWNMAKVPAGDAYSQWPATSTTHFWPVACDS